MRIGKAGDITPLVSDSPAFLSPLDLERLYLKESRERYGEWVTDSRCGCTITGLLIYFSFEDDRHPGSRVLVNAARRSGEGRVDRRLRMGRRPVARQGGPGVQAAERPRPIRSSRRVRVADLRHLGADRRDRAPLQQLDADRRFRAGRAPLADRFAGTDRPGDPRRARAARPGLVPELYVTQGIHPREVRAVDPPGHCVR